MSHEEEDTCSLGLCCHCDRRYVSTHVQGCVRTYVSTHVQVCVTHITHHLCGEKTETRDREGVRGGEGKRKEESARESTK
jgi:hypothetical protein